MAADNLLVAFPLLGYSTLLSYSTASGLDVAIPALKPCDIRAVADGIFLPGRAASRI